MNKKVFFIIFIIFILIYCKKLFSYTLGSNTAVTNVDTIVCFPAGEINTILGFTTLNKGFVLQDSTVVCTYDAFFPIAGIMSFNGGRLNLSQDLDIKSDTRVVANSGQIYADNHSVNFLNNTYVPFDIPESGDLLKSILEQTVNSNSVMSVDWSYDDSYFAVATLNGNTPGELRTFTFDGTSITSLATGTSWSICNSVKWRPGSNYLAVCGKASTGNNSFLYLYNQNLGPLSWISFGMLSPEIQAVSWRPDANYLAAGYDRIRIYLVNATATSLTYITEYTGLSVNQDAMDWDSTGNYLAVGDGNNLRIFSFNGTTLTLRDTINLGVTVNSVSWVNGDTYLAVGLDGATETLRVYFFNTGTLSLSETTSFRTGQDKRVLSVHWRGDSKYLGVGRENYNPSTGLAPELRIYESDFTDKTLGFFTGYNIVADVNSVRWTHDGEYIALGDSTNYARIYEIVDQVPTFTFDNVRLNFDSDVNFNAPILFQGDNIINGNFTSLNLTTSTNITLASDASLLFQNIIINNVEGDKITCVDNTGTYSFQNVTVNMSDDTNFSLGSFDVFDKLCINGPYTFLYDTTQTSTIWGNSTLSFDLGMTFSYDPIVSSNNLIAMEDQSSKLSLRGCNLHVCDMGLAFIKGAVEVRRKSFLSTEGTDGLMFGDGSNTLNDITYIGDFNLEISDDSILKLRNVN
jgi:hypothetical protein